MTMGDDDAVCFGRLCIEDDSDDNNDNKREEEDGITKTTTMQNNHSYYGYSVVGSLPSFTNSSSIINENCTLVCDAWYGFPTQKRPRRERINAVGRQIFNFLEWRHQHTQHHRLLGLQHQQQHSSSTKASAMDPVLIQNPPCNIAFLGAAEDVRAVQKRVIEISQQEQQCTTTRLHDDVAEKDDGAIQFQPNVTIQAFLLESPVLNRRQQGMQQLQIMNGDIDVDGNGAVEETAHSIDTINTDTTVYLSPDASCTLPITCRPPRNVMLGMLVDRHTIANRSQRRAENVLGMKAAQLPLKELNVSGLHSSEPLNVDTVMEMMQRWWWNCDELETKLERQRRQFNPDGDVGGNNDMEDAYRKCFLDAAAWALKSHRDRHPNRTLHS